jgi:hypothetical protein
MKVLIVHQTFDIEIRTMFNMVIILHTMMKVEKIKMKIFLTHQWLETWLYEDTINSKKLNWNLK